MEFMVMVQGRPAGVCTVEEQGLYWKLECAFDHPPAEGVRLFLCGRSLGLAERTGERWQLLRRVSKVSFPELSTPGESVLALKPSAERVQILDYILEGYLEQSSQGGVFRAPCLADAPHPCMGLFCFFSVENGFWTLRLDNNRRPVF